MTKTALIVALAALTLMGAGAGLVSASNARAEQPGSGFRSVRTHESCGVRFGPVFDRHGNQAGLQRIPTC